MSERNTKKKTQPFKKEEIPEVEEGNIEFQEPQSIRVEYQVSINSGVSMNPASTSTLANLISLLSEHIHYSTLLNSLGHLTSLLEGLKGQFAENEINQVVFNSLGQKCLCLICKKELYQVVTSCNHQFCEKCFLKKSQKQIRDQTFLCPKCDDLLTEEDLKTNLPHLWNQFKAFQADSRCDICRETITLDTILLKNCCPKKICLLCQIQQSKKPTCIGCNSQLHGECEKRLNLATTLLSKK